MSLKLQFPCVYLTADGTEYTLLGIGPAGKIMGAKDFREFDPETLKCEEDSKYDLVERRNPQRNK